MYTAFDFIHTGRWSLAQISQLAPRVPKKLIRNLSDRTIIFTQGGGSEARFYTTANALELEIIDADAASGADYRTAKLVAAAAVQRACARIDAGLIGTQKDMHMMVCSFRPTKREKNSAGISMDAKFCTLKKMPAVIEQEFKGEARVCRVLPVDEMIEALAERWRAMTEGS